MHIKKQDEITPEKIKEKDAENVYIQWLIDDKTGRNFAMRRFTIKKEGHTPYHAHDWEHEVFILDGKGALVDKNGKEHPLTPGTVAYVDPNENHQFKNMGASDFVFLCMIPFQ